MPKWAPAHAGLARVLEDEDPPKAAAAADKAIAIDPQLADAHLLLAGLHLDADRDAEARAEIDKVLAFNPSQLEAHALLAAMAYVKDDKAGVRARGRDGARDQSRRTARSTARRPAGRAATTASRRRRRSPRRRSALDPTSSRAAGDLGMHLMRTGDEAGARRALDRALRGDPFDMVTFNLLEAARQPRPVHDGPAKATSSSRCSATKRRCCASTRMPLAQRRVQDAVGALRLHADRADPRRDLPAARRLRGAQPRAARA